jgi:DNA repair protein RadA/Sms
VLIGGDPGIGKSTLLLQAGCILADKYLKVLYVSGEESIDQIRLRSQRLGMDKMPLALVAATSVRDIVATMEDASQEIDLVIIDSIQTMFVDTVESAPGTVAQVRTSAQEIIRVARKKNTTVLFVGHVTKEGQIAGPRVLEHMVDTVLYFEGDRGHQFRILRAIKNRFGPTDEIGVFEMTQSGLQEIENPSELFLSHRQENTPGSAVLAALEGSRPVLVEVQALVAPAGYGTPRRAVIGWDANRLAMILAVLESRCGLHFSSADVYLNIAGGIRIQEPAADMAVAAALMSALSGNPLPEKSVYFGEIGLSGETRPVSQAALRLKEAARLGFESAVIPRRPKEVKGDPLKVSEISHVGDVVVMS